MTQSNSSSHPPSAGLGPTNYMERLALHCEILGYLISFSGDTDQELGVTCFQPNYECPFSNSGII